MNNYWYSFYYIFNLQAYLNAINDDKTLNINKSIHNTILLIIVFIYIHVHDNKGKIRKETIIKMKFKFIYSNCYIYY